MELWQSLTVFQKIVFCISAPFTLALGAQFLASLFGNTNFVEYSDVDPDAPIEDRSLDRGLRFSKGKVQAFKILCAFFAMGGWVTLAVDLYTEPVWALLAGVLAGAIAAGLVVLFSHLASKLENFGSIPPENAVGQRATVTIPIPPKALAPGQISFKLGRKTYELDAVWDGERFLSVGTEVTVVASREKYAIVSPDGKK